MKFDEMGSPGGFRSEHLRYLLSDAKAGGRVLDKRFEALVEHHAAELEAIEDRFRKAALK